MPSTVTVMAAGLAAAEDAFSELAATFAAGGSFEEAFSAAEVAGEVAFDAYMGAAGTDVFGALVELGPEAVFSDPAALEAFGGVEGQFDQLATNFGIDLAQAGGDLGPVDEQLAGFDDVADQLSDEFAD